MAIGAYAVERDYSHYVSYVTKTVFAVVGTATKGPVNEATVCTSAQDLVNKFGPLALGSYALYAGQYFLSQASKLYFVRAAHDANLKAATASITGSDSEDDNVTSALTLEFLESGTYGNQYTVNFKQGVTGTQPNGKYTITLMKGNLSVEVIKNVSFSDLVANYKTSYFKIKTVSSTTFTSIVDGDYSFSGGEDGTTGIVAADYITAAEKLLSTQIDMNLFAVPGVYDPAVITKMLELAETRGDCLYLVDPPKGMTKDEVVAWHNGTGTNASHAAFNSSYGALYYDWVTIYDSVNKQRVLVPPSVPVAATIAYSDRISEPWYAPAGLTRGIISGVLESPTKLSRADTEELYTGEGNNINPIYEDSQVGLVLWGQKTLLRSDTALNRINVRRMMNYLKRVITKACDALTFEPNDRVTWNSFEQLVMPVLDSLKDRRGIYEYSLVRGESIVTSTEIDNYRMPCMIMLRPTKAAEEIPIHFVITSTGADFNEVLEANGIVEAG